MPSLEELILLYRRGADQTPLELELRFHNVDAANFGAVVAALLAGVDREGIPIGADPPTLTCMVGSLMGTVKQSRIREIYFVGGVRSHERNIEKKLLAVPWNSGEGGLAYRASLASEEEIPPFSCNGSALIRVKARLSFAIGEPGRRWRLDLTAVRTVAGNNAREGTPTAVAAMFRAEPPLTPATFLVRLGDADYKYEIEAEFTGPDHDALRVADATAVAALVQRLANPDYAAEAAVQAEIYRIAQYLVASPELLERYRRGGGGLKRLLPAAVAITRADYRDLYPPRGMYLTAKAEGIRAIAIVRDGVGVIVADRLYEFGTRTGGCPPTADGFLARPATAVFGAGRVVPDRPRPPGGSGETILDGEYILPAQNAGNARGTFYAFDLIAVDGESAVGLSLEQRIAKLPVAIELACAHGIPAAEKRYIRSVGETPAALEAEFRAAADAGIPTDGLILVAPGLSYLETKTYKWKPAEENTIDFLVRRAPASVREDTPDHEQYYLFVGIDPDLFERFGLRRCPGFDELFAPPTDQYGPVQFSPSGDPQAYLYQHPVSAERSSETLDGKVVEMRLGENGKWILVRIRADRDRDLASGRYYGNDYRVAEHVWLNYLDPFPREQLWEGPGDAYFRRVKADAYRAQTAALSFVKTQRINTLAHAPLVVDLACGKGQDLGRYFDAKVGRLVAVDQDRAALAELVRRRYKLARQKKAARTTVHILVADARDPAEETLARLKVEGKADALVCNLAVHYFLGSEEGLRNFATLARGVVRPGGQVILTILVGGAVHAAFTAAATPPGGTWDLRESAEAPKYSLRRMYTDSDLAPAGQKIGVLLPFSDGEYYEEYLVNTAAVKAEFLARGFSVLAETNAADRIPDFEARNRSSPLTECDRRYLGLYGELIFRRN